MTRLTLFLPKNARLTVKKAQKVVFGQNLTASSSGDTIIYDLVKLLSIKPTKTRSVVKKTEGEDITKGDILAAKKTLLGVNVVKAIASGKVTRIDEAKGQLTVTPSQRQDDMIYSPVSAVVSDIDKEKLSLDFNGIVFFGKQGVGEMKKGQLWILSNDEGDISLSDVTEEFRQKVLLGGHVSRQVLEKAFALGVASFIATAVDEGVFPYFEESKLFDASLLLIARADYNQLTKYQGKEAVVEGTHKRVIIEE